MQLASLNLDPPHDGISIAYADWGEETAEQAIVCVHGLTRNSRDFDFIAADLAARGARVIAIDVVGRGRSSWLADPMGYVIPNYVGQLLQFLQQLGLAQVDWIGTSMGGLIGMLVAAGEASPIRRLVLNDIGTRVPVAALQQLQSYVGIDRSFASLGEVEAYLRKIHVGFGPLTDEQWRHLALHSARQTDGEYRLHYDPAIKIPYRQMAADDVDLTRFWDRISCPTLLLRGSESQILPAEVADSMRETGPRASVVTFNGVGHAPALMARDQIATVEDWLFR
jgi:pimeloyl-ACP methyl ester carboxylesterase